MNKRVTESAIAVIVGVCWLALLWQGVSLFASVLMTGNTEELADLGSYFGSYKALIDFIKWSSVTVFLLLIPTIVCGALKIFTKNKIFSVICSALHFAALACLIGFYCKIYVMADSSESILQYIMAMGYFSDYIILMVATAVLCAYYAYESVLGFVSDRKGKVAEVANFSENTAEEPAVDAAGGER